MKRIILLLLLAITFSTAGAQNKVQEKKIKYFVTEATKELDLSKRKSRKLLKTRKQYVLDYLEIAKNFKKGDLSPGEKKVEINDVNMAFNSNFAEITGKPSADIKKFMTRMRKELPNIQ
ncbi:hypothetical protein [uncultured Algibacter sp.]|uniref:hypothetical protein n=1 Tax=uncultured Algibacter sp. TaxID=298659 RepID=UPI00321664CA